MASKLALTTFNKVKSKYLTQGVTEDNIDFAISAVLDGTKRDHIIETLTASYRGMTESQSTELLEELFTANGGEFKKENRDGYLYGVLFCLLGVASISFLIMMLLQHTWKIKFIAIALLGTFLGLVRGPMLIVKAIKGRYREEDDPFKE